MAYNIKINGIDRTTDVIADTLMTDDNLNDSQDTCSFNIINRSGNGFPANEQEVIITLSDGTRIFAGIIIKTEFLTIRQTGITTMIVSCTDYVRLFDSNLVHQNYLNMTDAQIIDNILTTYCSGFGITDTNVISAVTIDQISFNYIQPSQAMRRLCDLTGRNWYIDYNKDLHYFPIGTDNAPFNITDSVTSYWDLDLALDNSQLKNRVYVRGGTKLSDPTTYSTKGDGATTKFVLPDKPHNVSLTVNGVAKSVGIKNIDLSGFNYYLNYEEKYLEQDSTGVVLTSSDTLTLTYQYDIPILISVENTASIMANGSKEFAIFDNTIATDAAANLRASAELTDYAAGLYEGSFSTMTPGFKSGQTITINSASRGINQSYIVTKVHGQSIGGGVFQYQITLASAKTMGIIRFLIEMLEANKNLILVSNTETVDNLLTVTDSLLSDSITDSLIIDSAGPYATWCPDSISTTPTTIAKWDLFQWG